MSNIYNAIQNVYNMDKITWQEVLAELYNLVSNVENKFDLFENKFGSLLGKEVTRELKKMYNDGSLATIINDKLLKDIKTKVDVFKIEQIPDYKLNIGKCNQTGERKELASVLEKDDKGCVETYLVEAVDVRAENFRAQNTLFLESNNGEVKVVLYGGSEKALQPQDSLNGQIQLGTPWGAWKSIFTAKSYSNNGIAVDNVRVASNEEITLDNAIDSIEFISTARTTNTELQMNVTKLLDTNFVETCDKTEDVFINESELLKLAILEIKKLKNEIKELKIKIYGE